MPADEIAITDAGPNQVGRRALVAAPAAELFALVADPHRHGELDGSGTVHDTVSGPDRLSKGAKFSVKMTQHGVPYRITSRVTAYEENRLIEWRHPLRHRWRWEFTPVDDTHTEVTETFDYSHSGPWAIGLQLGGFPKKNGAGISATLTKLQARYR